MLEIQQPTNFCGRIQVKNPKTNWKRLWKFKFCKLFWKIQGESNIIVSSLPVTDWVSESVVSSSFSTL